MNAGAGDADAADPTAATASADTSLRDLNQDTVTQVFIMFYRNSLILCMFILSCGKLSSYPTPIFQTHHSNGTYNAL